MLSEREKRRTAMKFDGLRWDVQEFSDEFMTAFLIFKGAKYGVSVDYITGRIRIVRIQEESDVYKVCEMDTRRKKGK